MAKIKYLIAGTLIVCVGVLTASLSFYKKSQKKQTRNSSQTLATIKSEAEASQDDTIGLQVAPNTIAGDLDQLSISSGESKESPATKSANSKALDPSTFAQYEKYKDQQTALFGEMQIGTGAELTNDKKAAVLYKVWLTNGTLVDMSRTDDKGQVQPFIFTMGAHQVIAGWEQAMTGMKVGGTRLIIVPPAAGYGATAKENIPANSVLIFQVQLLEAL